MALLASGLCSAGAQTPSSTVATPETGSNALIMGALGLCATLGIALALEASVSYTHLPLPTILRV